MKCTGCGKTFYVRLTPEQFRRKFKIGDTITCWKTGKTARITAMGKIHRFLYIDNRGKECVASMLNAWRKV